MLLDSQRSDHAHGPKAVQGLLEQGSKRRVFGDIGNLVPPSGAANPNKAKSNTGALKKNPIALAPRTRSQTRAQGKSLSALLEARAEQALAPSKSKPIPLSPLPDIDSKDKANPLAAADYAADIFVHYKNVEPKFRVSPKYMTLQTDINEKMRAILIDWLVEVHLKFKLMPETLFLTANLIDRFLEARQVTRKNLQLVGVTAMLLASKYEEIWAPEVRDFVYISDKAYSREQILAMEKQMLNTLQFNLTVPTQHNFLGRYLKAAGYHTDKSLPFLASYVAELALVDYSMLNYSYSVISAAAIHVALVASGKEDVYPRALAKHSGYSLEDVLPCAKGLVQLMKGASHSNLNAVFKKYSHLKFMEVAKVGAPTLASDLQ